MTEDSEPIADSLSPPDLLTPVDRLRDGKLQLHLLGFRGSGKSTVGKLVARRLLWNFLDLDTLVERAAGRSVAEIFAAAANEGGRADSSGSDAEEEKLFREAEFRRWEQHALRQAVQKPRTVLALGGGTPIDPDNREISGRAAVTVWLRCSFETLRTRVTDRETARQGRGGLVVQAVRPLWSSDVKARELYEQRQSVYGLADAVVDANNSPDEVAERVCRAVLDD